MYLINWEYGGMAPKYYDIADMFQEILVPRDVEKDIVDAYCSGEKWIGLFSLSRCFLFYPFNQT